MEDNFAWDWCRSAEIAWKQSQMEPGRESKRMEFFSLETIKEKIILNEVYGNTAITVEPRFNVLQGTGQIYAA